MSRDEGADPIFPRRTEHDFRAIFCEKAGRAFAQPAASPGDDYNLAGDS